MSLNNERAYPASVLKIARTRDTVLREDGMIRLDVFQRQSPKIDIELGY